MGMIGVIVAPALSVARGKLRNYLILEARRIRRDLERDGSSEAEWINGWLRTWIIRRVRLIR